MVEQQSFLRRTKKKFVKGSSSLLVSVLSQKKKTFYAKVFLIKKFHKERSKSEVNKNQDW